MSGIKRSGDVPAAIMVREESGPLPGIRLPPPPRARAIPRQGRLLLALLADTPRHPA